MKRLKVMTNRVLSLIISITMMISMVLTGYTPVWAEGETDSGITLTVIGDTGNHGENAAAHTGYVYWLKDYPIELDLNSMEDRYIVKNAGDQIRTGLASAGIEAAWATEGTLYPEKFTKEGIELASVYPNGYWSVIVAYADGTFNSMGWGEGNGSAQLAPGARLIYYWCDASTDCRIVTDENWNTSLLYDTDAVTAVSLYTDENPDEVCTALTLEAGNSQIVKTRMTVPPASTVSRELTWESSNPTVAEAAAVDGGMRITAKAAGSTEITASMTNTLGDLISASCTVTVTADGTVITGISFEEGDTRTMEPGDVDELTPVFTPALEEGETAPTITWASSAPEVVTVDNGELEAVGSGTAEITATITNNQGAVIVGTCTVTVNAVELTAITAEPSVLGIEKNETAEIELIPTPINATEIPEITWTTSSDKVAVVTGDGMRAQVRAIGGGTAVITATAGELTATVNVNVQGEAVDEVVPLKDIFIAKDTAGKTPYTILSRPSEGDNSFVVAIPESEQVIAFNAILEDGIDATARLSYVNYNSAEKEVTLGAAPVELKTTNRLFNSNSRTAKDMTLTVTYEGKETVYTIHCIRETYIGSMSAVDNTGAIVNIEPAFSSAVREYTAVVPESVTAVKVTAGHANTVGGTNNVILVNGEAADDTTVMLPLTGDENIFTLASASEGNTAAEYTLTIYRQGEVSATFTTVPEDAVVSVYNSYGQRIPLTDNTLANLPGEYTYTVTKPGYKAAKGSFSLYGRQNISVELQPVEEVTYTQFDATWPGLRNNPNNSAIVSAPTPNEPDSAVLKWAKQFGSGYGSGATGVPILLGDYLYTYAGSTILKLDKTTGDVLMSGPMVTNSSFAINAPTYAEGMIFVGLSGGRVQAFNADTLESLWVYTDPLGGQPNCSIRYDSGCVYTGFWNSETKDANFVCLTIDDEDTTKKTEAKTASWTYTSKGGFYWAGAFTKGDYLVVTTDDGESGYESETASLLVLNKYNGNLSDIKTGYRGDLRSDVSYDPDLDRVFFTSKGEQLHSEKIDWTTGKIIRDEYKVVDLGGMSTSTPIIYNNRAYLGVSGSGQFTENSGHQIAVIDLTNWSIAYRAYTGGYPQTSGVLTTAYEEDGYVYVYFFDNQTPGWLRYVKDAPGVTEVLDGTERTVEVNKQQYTRMFAPIVFTPSGAQAQYCICSPVVDNDGTIYFKNDSAYMMAITMSQAQLTGASVTGGNASMSPAFAATMLNYDVAVDAGTTSVRLDLTAEDGSDIEINGVLGGSRNITLTGEETLVTAVVTNTSGKTGTYTFRIRERNSNAELKDLHVYTSSTATTELYTLAVEKGEEANEYTTVSNAQTVYIVPTAADSKATVQVSAVSGVSGSITLSSGKYTTKIDGNGPAIVTITVTAEDGSQEDYRLTVSMDTAKPTLTAGENAIFDRKVTEASAAVTTSGAEYVYYLVQDAAAKAPTATTIINTGTKAEVEDGLNTIAVKGLAAEEAKLYMIARSHSIAQSALLTIAVPAGPDYSAVNEALLQVPNDLSAYTEESVAALEAAVAAVDRTLTTGEQTRIDAMAEAILAAIEGLEEKKGSLLESVALASSASAQAYPIVKTPEDGDNTYAIAVPETQQNLYFTAVLAEGVTGQMKLDYTNYNSKETSFTLKNGTAQAMTGNNRLITATTSTPTRRCKDLTLTVTTDGEEQVYTIKVVRETYLKTLAITDQDGSVVPYTPAAFAYGTKEYSAKVTTSVNSVTLDVTHYSANTENTLLVNGEAVEGTTVEIPLTAEETVVKLASYTEDAYPGEYTITIQRLAPAHVSFNVTPEDAVVAVYGEAGNRIKLTDNAADVIPGTITYTAAKSGYKGVKENLTVDKDQTITITLETVPEASYTEYAATWPAFRNDANNNGITDAPTPYGANGAILKWAYKGTGYAGPPIVVGDYIYTYYGTTVAKLDKETGEVLLTGTMEAANSFTMVPPTYAEGMLFVPENNGTVQAFNAETLQSLWIYHDPLKGQPDTTIRYEDGYLYTGFWLSAAKEANYVCLTIDDEDLTKTNEEKTAVWTYASAGGFYWSGCFTKGDYLVVGLQCGASSAGTASYNGGLAVLNKHTGEVVSVKRGYMNDIRCEIVYDETLDRVFFTSTGGQFYSEKINWQTGQIVESESRIVYTNGGSRGTPVIYKNRAYVTTGGGLTDTGSMPENNQIIVIDLTTWEIVYRAYCDTAVKTSGVLTTAYEDEQGYVYVYFVGYKNPSEVFCLKDGPNVTSVQDGTDLGDGRMKPPVLFVPTGGMAQFNFNSAIADNEGTIYFKNDSGYIMALKANRAELTGVVVTGGNAVMTPEFSADVKAYEVVVDKDTEAVRLDLTAAEGDTVTINGTEGLSRIIALEGEETVVTAVVENTTGASAEYTFTIIRHSEDPVVPADYSKVDAALKKVPKNLSGYTKASADALKKAVAAVKRGLNSEDQAKVDKMAKDIEAAIKGLKKDLNTMYRLYNPNSGEHFYTASTGEKNALVKVGWKYEGIAWYAPKTSKTPVYRLYNPNAGDHHYTTNAAEKNALVKMGWNYEGIGWYSCDEKEVTLYRLYNPNAKGAGAHHYTTNAGEKKALVKIGWKDEGIAWYGCKQ